MRKVMATLILAAAATAARDPNEMKVAWASSKEAASEAAKTSGKPVLVFQLLGKLTDEYC